MLFRSHLSRGTRSNGTRNVGGKTKLTTGSHRGINCRKIVVEHIKRTFFDPYSLRDDTAMSRAVHGGPPSITIGNRVGLVYVPAPREAPLRASTDRGNRRSLFVSAQLFIHRTNRRTVLAEPALCIPQHRAIKGHSMHTRNKDEIVMMRRADGSYEAAPHKDAGVCHESLRTRAIEEDFSEMSKTVGTWLCVGSVLVVCLAVKFL